MAPMLSMVVSSPYVPPVPWNVSLANTGKTTAKLKAKSPTTDIMRRGSQSCWRPAAYRKPFLDAPASRRGGSARLAGPDDEQGGDHGQVGQRVQPKAHRRAHRHDQHAGQGGADHPGAVDHHPVEADRAGQVVGRHETADEGLAGGRVGDLDDAPGHADGHERRHAGLARCGQRPQQGSQEAIERLGDDEELAQVHPVGHRPAPGAEQQRRDSPGRQDQPEIAGRTGELEDEPADGRLLQEAAAGRDDLAPEVEAEGPGPQGTKRAAALGRGRRLGPRDRPRLRHGGQCVTVHRASAARVQRRPSIHPPGRVGTRHDRGHRPLTD